MHRMLVYSTFLGSAGLFLQRFGPSRMMLFWILLGGKRRRLGVARADFSVASA